MRLLSLLLLVTLLTSSVALGTEQESDVIFYRGERCELETHWMFPSALQVYFLSDDTREYPFKSSSTANYRGHVATWEISDKRLYLVGIEPSDRPHPKGHDGEQTKEDLDRQSQELLRKIFTEDEVSQGKIFAKWFSGNLRIFSKPVKREYKHQNDEEGYELEGYDDVSLLQLKDGVVVRETSFPVEEYWSKFNTFLEYRKLNEEEVAAIAEHVEFLDGYSDGWEEIGSIEPEGPMHSEEDFSVFLTRHLTQRVRIPLTDFAIVQDATIDLNDTSYTIGSDLRIKDGKHLLFLEMGAVGVPRGPWSNFTRGSVQVVVQLGDLSSKEIKFTEKDKDVVKFINNFGGPLNPRRGVGGSLSIEIRDASKVQLSGFVRLTSEEPTTYQEILLEEDIVPVYTIKEYLKLEYDPLDPISRNADEVYKSVVEKSFKSAGNDKAEQAAGRQPPTRPESKAE